MILVLTIRLGVHVAQIVPRVSKGTCIATIDSWYRTVTLLVTLQVAVVCEGYSLYFGLGCMPEGETTTTT